MRFIGTILLVALSGAGAAQAAGSVTKTSGYLSYNDGADIRVYVNDNSPTEKNGVPVPRCDVSIEVLDENRDTIATQTINARPQQANYMEASLPATGGGRATIVVNMEFVKQAGCNDKLLEGVFDPGPDGESRYRIASLIK